ncbi:MAG TPA: formylglycine-generating enzyme family protein [Vicinamibacterales bacterium]|jgi:formylglycine-generating enzyme required for sulfatase activity|nr:formylglycine-generating enzyme family protein [Vicinamibacterales bacterium]
MLRVFACAWLLVGIAAQGSPPSAYRESIPGTLVTFEMVPVPGGSITVDGKPAEVRPFYIGRTEVTWDMFDVFALGLDAPQKAGRGDATARPSRPYGAPDYGWGHTGYPVISVTRAAAEAFAEWLSEKTGKKYRLPTDAEWQHVARLAAGSDQLPRSRSDELAWHRGNASAKTHGVGSKAPDALGLVDLFGNAAEWVTTSDGSPVVRGGSFRDPAERTGPAAREVQDESWNLRDPQFPKSKWWLSDGPFVGFRLVRDP